MSTKRGILLVVCLALVLAFAFQGTRGLYETTEGRYAESAREMLETGNWLVPMLDYTPHWTKPPLTYWAIAGGVAVLGENEWGVRAASGLAYLVTALAVFGLGSAMWGRRTGVVSALVYSTSLFAVVAANSVSTDPLLAMWEALVALSYWRSLRAEASTHASRWMTLFWLFNGLAFLTKGPPALLTLLAVLIYHAWRLRTHRESPRLGTPSGLALFLVVGFWWYVFMVVREQGLFTYLVRDEVVGRIFTAESNRNPEWYMPFLVLIPPLVLGLGGWLWFWPRLWRRYGGITGLFARFRARAGNQPAVFCLLWLAAPLLVLSFSRSRLPLYVLPFLPGLAILTGRGIVVTAAERGKGWLPARFAVTLALALLVLKAVASYMPSSSDVRPVYDLVRSADTENAGGDRVVPFVYAYELPEHYGLMFYLKGRMLRVSASDDQPWAGLDGTGLVGELTSGEERRPGYVVVRRARRSLEELLSGAGLSYRSVSGHGHAVYVVEPRFGSPAEAR